MMKICIWQYRPSIHQLSLMKSLNDKCILEWVIEKDKLDISRKKMGWSEKFEVQYNLLPDFNSMRSFLNNIDDSFVHVFGGIRSSKNLTLIIKHLLGSGKRVFIQSEAPNYFGLKGLFRILRTFIDNYYFYRKIEGVFAIGSLGFNFYNKTLPSSCKIYPWAYFVDKVKINTTNNNQSEIFKIIYIGSLTKTKGVIYILKALNQINFDFKFSIIGKGPEFKKLNKFVSDHKKINDLVSFHDFIPNNDVQKTISHQDLLILPSINKDGWGVVVSEALSVGTPVIVSERCGSSVLLSDAVRGSIVKSSNVSSLKNAIINQIKKGKIKEETRNDIIKWSINLSADKAAEYMIDCINDKRAIAPWL